MSSEEQYFVDDQAYAPMEEMEPKRWGIFTCME